MNLIFKTFLSVGLIFTLTGCSSTNKIGTVGHMDFYKVHAGQFDGPNFTALVTHNQITKEVGIEYVFGSAGIGTSIIAAGGNVGAAAAFGASLPRSNGDTVNVSGGNATATSNSKNVNNNNNKNTAAGGNGGNGGSHNGGGKGGGTSNHGSHGNHGKFEDHDHGDDDNSHKSYFRGLKLLW